MNFKELLAGIALLVLLGIAGFLYRNALSRPVTPAGTACTLEAKMCPDGTSVGRTGPDCAFASCPLPNVDMTDEGIAYAIPMGFSADENAIGAEPTLRAAFVKSATSTGSETIEVRDYPIPAGKTANDAIIGNTVYGASGKTAASMSEFKPVTISGETYYYVVLERFEGTVHTAYYLPRTNDIVRFEAIQTGVTNWTDANLDPTKLEANQALLGMLATLQLEKQ